MKNNKKGVVTIWIFAIILFMVLIFMGAIIAPIGGIFSSKMYSYGDKLIIDLNESLEDISDSSVRSGLHNITSSASSSQQFNIEVSTAWFKYSAIIAVFLTALVFFIATRQLSEVGGRVF